MYEIIDYDQWKWNHKKHKHCLKYLLTCCPSKADQYSIIEEAPLEETTSNTDETSAVADQEKVEESKEAEATQDEQKTEPAEEVKAEENKEEAPAQEAEKKTDEQS